MAKNNCPNKIDGIYTDDTLYDFFNPDIGRNRTIDIQHDFFNPEIGRYST